MKLMIDQIALEVDWKDNASVKALREQLAGGDLQLVLSQYGDFEQVGQLGFSLPSNDKQQTAQAGDLMLYQGKQLVIFYGQNSWSYTKLGHITTDTDLSSLLDKDQVTVTLTLEN